MKTKSIVKGALILTSASIITRILGFVYRVYMSNVIGAEGMGLYQLIMPLYMLVYSISSSGFSTTISKLTAQENAKREYGNMGRILKQSIFTSSIIAFILSVVVFLFAEQIGTLLFHDTRTIKSLKLLSICFPFMAAGSCIRGYFFGLQEAGVPAISQVFEQSTRMITIYILSTAFVSKGLEYAVAAAVIGMCMGEILSFLYVLFSYRVFKTKNSLNKRPSLNPFKAYTMILIMAIPLTANRVTGSLLSTIENILIPQKLQEFGLTGTQAMSTYGQISGMAMPLLMFPSSLLTALSTALIPAVSEARAIQNSKRISSTVTKSMLFTSIIGVGTAGLFVTFPNEIGMAIYNQKRIGELLYLMGFICPFLYYQVTLSGILNGLGEQVFIFRNSIISSAINIFFVYFLVPVYGINAFIIGWFVSLIIISFLDIQRVLKRTYLTVNVSNWILKPLICIIACSMCSKFIYFKFLLSFGNILGLILAVLTLAVLYFILLIFTQCLKIEDLKSIIKSAF